MRAAVNLPGGRQAGGRNQHLALNSDLVKLCQHQRKATQILLGVHNAN